MSKNQKGLLKRQSFFLKKWFSLEMLWNFVKGENICDDNIFLNNCGKGLGELSIAYIKQQNVLPKQHNSADL